MQDEPEKQRTGARIPDSSKYLDAMPSEPRSPRSTRLSDNQADPARRQQDLTPYNSAQFSRPETVKRSGDPGPLHPGNSYGEMAPPRHRAYPPSYDTYEAMPPHDVLPRITQSAPSFQVLASEPSHSSVEVASPYLGESYSESPYSIVAPYPETVYPSGAAPMRFGDTSGNPRSIHGTVPIFPGPDDTRQFHRHVSSQLDEEDSHDSAAQYMDSIGAASALYDETTASMRPSKSADELEGPPRARQEPPYSLTPHEMSSLRRYTSPSIMYHDANRPTHPDSGVRYQPITSVDSSKVSSRMSPESYENAVKSGDSNPRSIQLDDQQPPGGGVGLPMYSAGSLAGRRKTSAGETQGLYDSEAMLGSQRGSRRVCMTCGKSFARPSALRTHMYTHTGEKPFKCDYIGCTQSFSVQSNLRRHQRIHQDKK